MAGADTPRQNAACASDVAKRIEAEIDARSSRKSTRIVILPPGSCSCTAVEGRLACGCAQPGKWCFCAKRPASKCQRAAELPRQFGVDVPTLIDPFMRTIDERSRIAERPVSNDSIASAYMMAATLSPLTASCRNASKSHWSQQPRRFSNERRAMNAGCRVGAREQAISLLQLLILAGSILNT